MDGPRCSAGADACVDVEVALAFVDGQLPPPARGEVERRIDGCTGCRAVVAAAARGDETRTRIERVRPAMPRVATRDRLVPGDVVGRYVVERALGAGGMGVVSLARDPELRRAVVIKLVRPDVEASEAFEARLQREAQSMAQLSHPNVVQIFDIGRHGDRVFLAMEFIAGQTLDAWLIERERTPDEIVAMFRQAGAGLDAAHRAGLVHRDFKPTNVLVNGDGVAKVTDFGLARGVASQAADAVSTPRPSGVHAVLTRADSVIGTPAYMSPEQAAGRPLDARTDQYAFALALLDALVGQSPVQRTVQPTASPEELEAALAKTAIDARAGAAIERALRPDPAARFPSFGELLRELAPERRERRIRPVLALAALAAGAIAVWLAARGRGEPACVARAPDWWEATRPRVQSALEAEPRLFASWGVARVTGAFVTAVARQRVDELAVCERAAGADPACVERRRRSLEAAAEAIAARPEERWLLLPGLEECTEPPDRSKARTELATLRGEVRTISEPARLRELAARAVELGDGGLAADAYDAAFPAALATGDAGGAEGDLRKQRELAEDAADDAVRGRVHVRASELARWKGSHDDAVEAAKLLKAILRNHDNQPRAVAHAVAMVQAAAYTELGDVPNAAAAWTTALAEAQTDDEQLRARTGRAWLDHHLRFDRERARADLVAALAAARSASGATRAEAHVALADMALASGDGKSADHALREAHRLDPVRATQTLDLIRAARARALAGDEPGALALLERVRGDDAATKIRVRLARARIAHAAGRAREALEILVPPRSTDPSTPWKPQAARELGALPLAERIDALLAQCRIEADVLPRDGYAECGSAQMLLPARTVRESALRVHVQEAAAAFSRTRNEYLAAISLKEAIEVLTAIGGGPLHIAELRWQLVALPAAADLESKRRIREHAEAALRGFEVAGRTREAAEVKRWLDEHGDPDAPSPTRPPDAAPGPAPPPASTPDAFKDEWG